MTALLESGIGRAHNIAIATLAGFTCRVTFPPARVTGTKTLSIRR